MKQKKPKEVKSNTTISPAIPLSHLRKFVSKFDNLDGKTPISLELLLMGTFPTVWNNVVDYTHDCYTQGYAQARKELLNEDKGNN